MAAIPASYLDGFIPLNEDNGEFYSIIIRRDGTYIISPSDATRENYFDRAAALSSPALREARKGSGSTTSTRGPLTTSWCPSSAQEGCGK